MESIKQVIDESLHIGAPILEDNSIEHLYTTQILPTNQASLQTNSGDIRFQVNQSDQFLLPHKSYIRLTGRVTKQDGSAITAVDEDGDGNLGSGEIEGAPVHNCWSQLFTEVKYYMGGQTIETNDYFDTTNTIYRNLISTNSSNNYSLEQGAFSLDTTTGSVDGGYDKENDLPIANNVGWETRRQFFTRFDGPNRGSFSFQIPLEDFLGFARDHKQCIFGLSHELVLTRKSLADATLDFLHFRSDPTVPANKFTPKVVLEHASWHVPIVRPSLAVQEKLNQMILNKTEYPIAFRALTSSSYTVPTAGILNWNAASTMGAESPLYAIIAFKRASRQSSYTDSPAIFDDLDAKDVSIYINGVRVPQEARHYIGNKLDFTQAYGEMQEFKHKYLGLDAGHTTPIDIFEYKNLNMFYVIDLNHTAEIRRGSVANIRVSATFEPGVPQGYNAYLLLITKKILTLRSNGDRFTIIQG